MRPTPVLSLIPLVVLSATRIPSALLGVTLTPPSKESLNLKLYVHCRNQQVLLEQGIPEATELFFVNSERVIVAKDILKCSCGNYLN